VQKISVSTSRWPTRRREEHGHRRQHGEPRETGMEREQIGASDRPVRTVIDDREREVSEHHHHQRADASHVDRASTARPG